MARSAELTVRLLLQRMAPINKVCAYFHVGFVKTFAKLASNDKITIGKNVDKLDHVWSYAELSKQKLAVSNEIESLLKKASIANDINDTTTADDLQNQINSFKEHSNELDKQIEQYAY